MFYGTDIIIHFISDKQRHIFYIVHIIVRVCSYLWQEHKY
jgi:hypothetical protein